MQLSARCRFLQGHWALDVRGRFDVVFINPPYVAHGDIAGLEPEVGHYEPADALSGGADGLDAYRSIAPSLASLLDDGSRSYVEVGHGQAGDAEAILTAFGLRILRRTTDLAGRLRCLVVARE